MHATSNWNSSARAQFAVHNDTARRTLYLRMAGVWTEQELDPAIHAFLQASGAYEGAGHLILADVRGMTLSGAGVARRFGEAIHYTRSRGVVLCVHLSDSTLTRLQAARIAREYSPGDDVTVDVISMEEGERVLEETRARLGWPTRGG